MNGNIRGQTAVEFGQLAHPHLQGRPERRCQNFERRFDVIIGWTDRRGRPPSTRPVGKAPFRALLSSQAQLAARAVDTTAHRVPPASDMSTGSANAFTFEARPRCDLVPCAMRRGVVEFRRFLLSRRMGVAAAADSVRMRTVNPPRPARRSERA